jgi:translation initiation factor 3 subunit I
VISFLFQLYDTATLECLKVFESDRPLNSAAVSPFGHHVLLGGGQEASSVTTTASRQGKFEAMFYSCPFQELYGSVKGHFGPINSLCFGPDGKRFALSSSSLT